MSRSRGSPLVGAAIVAALVWSAAPALSARASGLCHAPAAGYALVLPHDHCGQLDGTACAFLSGCGAMLAMLPRVPRELPLVPVISLVELEQPVGRDLAWRSPPTPPPNR